MSDRVPLSEAKRRLLEKALRGENSQTSAGHHTIPRHPRDRPIPLSFAQQRLWFLDQLSPGSCAYNIGQIFRLRSSIDIGALRRSVEEIVRRHESLRTTFAERDEQPVQVITPGVPIEIPILDLTTLPDSERTPEAQRIATAEMERPFDLAHGPLFRIRLIQLGSSEHLLLLTMHHIISDGWSMGIFFREFETLYLAFRGGQPSTLPALKIQYADFAVWQREWLRGERLDRQLTYWRTRLSGAPPVLDLAPDRPRPVVQGTRGAHHRMRLAPALTEAIHGLSRREGVTLFMALLAAFQTLIFRWTGREDVVVGTDIANRTHVETESLIGFFVNLLVLRSDLSANPTFRELLLRVREVALGAYAHQDVPFEKLVEQLQPERNLARNPLVQILIVMQMPNMPGLEITPFEVERETSRFDLVLFFAEREPQLSGTWLYNADLFDASTVARMASQFETLLGSIVAEPNARLDALELLTEEERRQRAREKTERQEAQAGGLRGARRRALDLSGAAEVTMDFVATGQGLPLVLQPAVRGELDLADWAQSRREFLGEKLLKHGAILFRGFGVRSAAEFERFASTLCPELFGEYGDLPREAMGGKVYGSTPYPSDQPILFHNESSHMHRWPMKIWFFCVQAAEQGGETPIVDCRKVFQRLDPGLRRRFSEKGLMYVRNYTEGLDVSWQSFYGTDERPRVEDLCRQAGADFEWRRDKGLRTRQLCPAVVRHPQSGEMAFFNQLQLHHVSCLDPGVRASLSSLMPEEDLPRNVYFGDGSRIEDSVMDEIRGIYREKAVEFPWRAGDVLMLNNMLTAHARNPYVGARKILVAMGEMVRKDEVST